MLTEDEKQLKKELEQYKAEKEKIRQVLGSIGGRKSVKRDRIINYIFATVVITLFGVSFLRFANIDIYFNADFYIEI